MKKILLLLALAFTMLSTVSCGVFSNMSNEDAYNVGYGAGTLIRNIIDQY